MLELGRADIADVPPATESVISVYRVAIYLRQLREALRAIEKLKKLGYQVSLNIAEVSTIGLDAIADALAEIRVSDVDVVYVVDTRGALMPGNVRELTRLYVDELHGIPVGIHAHNNFQLALANTLAAIDAGASYADASVFGIGRGAGNCAMEQLLLAIQHSRYQLGPILDLIEEMFLPLLGEVDFPWGYQVPYLLTAAFGEHHKTIMERSPAVLKKGFAKLLSELAVRSRGAASDEA